jgi:hypothetical protein
MQTWTEQRSVLSRKTKRGRGRGGDGREDAKQCCVLKREEWGYGRKSEEYAQEIVKHANGQKGG